MCCERGSSSAPQKKFTPPPRLRPLAMPQGAKTVSMHARRHPLVAAGIHTEVGDRMSWRERGGRWIWVSCSRPLHHPAVPTCCQSSAIRPQAILLFTDIPCAANSARLFLDRFLLATVMWPVKADIDAVYIEGANFPQNCIFLTVVKPLKQQLL